MSNDSNKKEKVTFGLIVPNLKRIFLYTILILFITISAMMLQGSISKTLDFGSFAASGINLNQGINPYDTSSPLIFEIYFPVINSGGRLPNLNPPITLPFFSLITEDNLANALMFWRGFSFLLYNATVFSLTRFYKSSITHLIWSFTLAGFWHTLELGQIYVPLLFFTACVWILTEKGRDIEAGIFLGLLASIKPNFLIWVLLLLAARNWKMSFSAIITTIVTLLIPLFLYGFNIYIQWLDVIGVSRNIIAMPGNSSLPGFFSRFNLLSLGTLISILLLLLSLYFIMKHSEPSPMLRDKNVINVIGLIVSLLASPISWAGYTILLLPIFLSKNTWDWPMTVSSLILSLPFPFILQLYNASKLAAILSGFAYTLPLIICLVTEFKHLSSRAVPSK